MQRLLWFDATLRQCAVWLDDGQIILARMSYRPGQRPPDQVEEALAILETLGWVEGAADTTLHPCDRCRETWSQRAAFGETPSEDAIRSTLGRQRLLLHGDHPWVSGPGYYCFGCSVPPR